MTILIGLLICHPIAMNWDTTLPGGYCGDEISAYSAVGIIDLVIDIAIFILPIPMVVKLQVSTAHKMALGVIFGAGILFVSPFSFVFAPCILFFGPSCRKRLIISDFFHLQNDYLRWSPPSFCLPRRLYGFLVLLASSGDMGHRGGRRRPGHLIFASLAPRV